MLEALKDEGNEMLKAGNFDEAVKKYSQAISAYESSSAFVDALVVAVCYANRSLVYLKVSVVEQQFSG
jgi:hypothetical protein